MARKAYTNHAHPNERFRDGLMGLVEAKLQEDGGSAFVMPCEDEDADEDVFSFMVSTLGGSKRVTVEDVYDG